MGAFTRLAWAPLVVGAALALAGCERVPVALPVVTPEPVLEGTPEVALLLVSGDPAVAADGLVLRMDDPDGTFSRTIRFHPGERVIAQLGVDQGAYTLGEDGGACTLDLALLGGREVDVLVAVDDGGTCTLAVTGDHEPDTAGHPLFGGVSVTIPAVGPPADLLRVRSLDTPPNPVPDPVAGEPDRPGSFTMSDLPQGRYEAQVIGGGAVMGTAVFEVGTGADAVPSITIPIANPDQTD